MKGLTSGVVVLAVVAVVGLRGEERPVLQVDVNRTEEQARGEKDWDVIAYGNEFYEIEQRSLYGYFDGDDQWYDSSKEDEDEEEQQEDDEPEVDIPDGWPTPRPSIASTGSPSLRTRTPTFQPTRRPHETGTHTPTKSGDVQGPSVSETPTDTPTGSPTLKPSRNPTSGPTIKPSTDSKTPTSAPVPTIPTPTRSPIFFIPTETPTRAPISFDDTGLAMVFASGTSSEFGRHAIKSAFDLQGESGTKLFQTCVLSWQVTPANPPSLAITIECQGDVWIAIGLGQQMIGSKVIVALTEEANPGRDQIATYEIGPGGKDEGNKDTAFKRLDTPLEQASYGVNTDGKSRLTLNVRSIGGIPIFSGSPTPSPISEETPPLGRSTDTPSPEVLIAAGVGILLILMGFLSVILYRQRKASDTLDMEVQQMIAYVRDGDESQK